MINEAMIEDITSIARTVFSQPALSFRPEQRFADLNGFDSIVAIRFILAIEEKFGILIPENQVDHMHTFGDLVEILTSSAPQ